MATKLRDSNRQSSAHVPVTELVFTSGPAHDERLDTRVTRLEARIDSLEAKIEAKFDSLEAKIDSKIDHLEVKLTGKLDRVIERMDQFPTKLQLALWAGGFISTVLVVAIAIIAILLRANGHPVAADLVETAIGK